MRNSAARYAIDRRSFLLRTLSAGVTSAWDGVAAAWAAEQGLKDLAAARGLSFGAAVRAMPLRERDDYAEAVRRECAIIVAENEFKWGALERQSGAVDYHFADRVAAFADMNGLLLRGHTLVWHVGLPQWVQDGLRDGDSFTIMNRHIVETMGRYSGVVTEWDVVNEALASGNGHSYGLRTTPFLAALGPDYIHLAFEAARAADPSAYLYYNDFGFEYDTRMHALRRQGLLNLLARLRAQGTPIDGVGLQCHLSVDGKFDAATYRQFLAEISAMGYRITITELDVADDAGTADEEDERDRIIGDHLRAFLDAALDEPAVVGILTWGLTDEFSWLNNRSNKRGISQFTRGLPLDADMRPTPVWRAIAHSIRHCTARKFPIHRRLGRNPKSQL